MKAVLVIIYMYGNMATMTQVPMMDMEYCVEANHKIDKLRESGHRAVAVCLKSTD